MDIRDAINYLENAKNEIDFAMDEIEQLEKEVKELEEQVEELEQANEDAQCRLMKYEQLKNHAEKFIEIFNELTAPF